MTDQAVLTRWDDLPLEQLNPLLSRRLLTGERMMVSQVILKKDCLVPMHHHENEQISYITEGAIRFLLGEAQEEEVIVRVGEVLVIPSNLPHSAEALEDSISVDIFCPPRQDWLDGSDDYLRG